MSKSKSNYIFKWVSYTIIPFVIGVVISTLIFNNVLGTSAMRYTLIALIALWIIVSLFRFIAVKSKFKFWILGYSLVLLFIPIVEIIVSGVIQSRMKYIISCNLFTIRGLSIIFSVVASLALVALVVTYVMGLIKLSVPNLHRIEVNK